MQNIIILGANPLQIHPKPKSSMPDKIPCELTSSSMHPSQFEPLQTREARTHNRTDSLEISSYPSSRNQRKHAPAISVGIPCKSRWIVNEKQQLMKRSWSGGSFPLDARPFLVCPPIAIIPPPPP